MKILNNWKGLYMSKQSKDKGEELDMQLELNGKKMTATKGRKSNKNMTLNQNIELENKDELSNLSLDEIDNKRKSFNNKKKDMVFNRKKEIIGECRILHDKRVNLQQSSLLNRTDAQYEEIADLNVQIAYELSKIQIKYQFQYSLFEKAKEYADLLSKIKSDSRKLFEMIGLPLDVLREYFSDNANYRWYVGHKFWNDYIKNSPKEYHEILNKAENVNALYQLDDRCLDFERLVGLSPTQYDNVYKVQIKPGMEQTSLMRDKTIVRNSRLAMAIATKIRRDKPRSAQNVTYSDMYMSSIEGLINGVENFEHKRGFRVSTYVTWQSRQKTTKGLEENRHIIKNTADKEIQKEIAIISRQYENRYYQEPTQKYLMMKCLLLEYIKIKKGIKNVLPTWFIEKHLSNTEVMIDKYIALDWSDIDGGVLGSLNSIKDEMKRENAVKMKKGKKSKNQLNEDKVDDFVLDRNELLWTYLLTLYEDLYGIDSFMEEEFFKEQFESLNDDGKSKKKDTKLKKIERVFLYSQPVVSLENEVGDEDNNTYRDTIKSEEPAIEDELIHFQYNESMKGILQETFEKYLKPKEAAVITLYYGLNVQSPQDLKTIASHLGVTVERVRQILNGTLKRMRDIPELQALRDGLNS